jgi:hypothetical protein
MTFELTWLDLGLIVLLAYAWGRYAQWRKNMHNLLNNPQRISDILAKYAEVTAVEQPQKDVELRVEWHDDQCYIYRKDTNEFMAQGRDITQAINAIDSRLHQGAFVVPKEMATKPQQNQP